MTLEQLRVFDAVVKYGSIRAASIHIHKSAPSLSSTIKALESQINIRLFSRDGYRLVVTDDGKMFHKKAQQTLKSVAELKSISNMKWNKKRKKFLIAVDAFVPIDLVTILLKVVETEFTDIQFNLFIDHYGNPLDKVYLQQADIIITKNPSTLSEQLEVKYLMSVSTNLVTSPLSDLAQFGRAITQAELLEQPQVAVKDFGHKLDDNLQDAFSNSHSLYVSDLNAQKSMIIEGMGWGYLPEHMVMDDLASGRLVNVNIVEFEKQSISQYLVRRMQSSVGSVADRVWDTLSNIDFSSYYAKGKEAELIIDNLNLG